MGSGRFVSALFAGEPLGPGLFVSKEKISGRTALWHYFPGGRNLTVFFVAWSTSSGVINTVIRDLTPAVALAVNDSADASTLFGRSTMTTKSLLPKA
jgi:hypothetical protein